MNNTTQQYRSDLPQLGGKPFLTDGGLETSLIYHENWELPSFAAFVLLDSVSGVASLNAYYQKYIRLALHHGMGFILESPTWRASKVWAEALGYTPSELEEHNARAIEHLAKLRDTFANESTPMVVSGCIGPQDDGYEPSKLMSVDQATKYHTTQVSTFARSQADMVCAITMTYAEEAIGIVKAAQAHNIPAAISFTVETNGALPSGQPLSEAIETVDKATNTGPAYFMVNCAHPTHFQAQLAAEGDWRRRIVGIRANASVKSHAELDCATTLDDGDPSDFGQQYSTLKQHLPNLNVYGGCCGTDHRHVEAIVTNCLKVA